MKSKKGERIGTTNKLKNGFTAQIIEYKNAQNIDIKILENNEIIKDVTYANFKKGEILPINSKPDEELPAECQVIVNVKRQLSIKSAEFAKTFSIKNITVRKWSNGTSRPPEYVANMINELAPVIIRKTFRRDADELLEELYGQELKGKPICEKLSMIRNKSRMPAKEFAAMYDIPYRTYWDWETEKRTPPDHVYELFGKTTYLRAHKEMLND